MNTTEIKSALLAAGIKTSTVTVIKNGIQCVGFRLDVPGNVSPVIYYSQNETLESFLERAKLMTESHYPSIDVNEIINREYIRNKVRLCIQKQGQEDIVKTAYLNLELYMRLTIEVPDSAETGTIKITSEFLKAADVDEKTCWEWARANTFDSIKIRSISEVIGCFDSSEPPFYVVTTSDSMSGAAALALPEVFDSFCHAHGVEDCYILPSSTEEVLICPCHGDRFQKNEEEASNLAAMVRQINEAEVEPRLQLEPVCYLFESVNGHISIAASAGKAGV